MFEKRREAYNFKDMWNSSGQGVNKTDFSVLNNLMVMHTFYLHQEIVKIQITEIHSWMSNIMI